MAATADRSAASFSVGFCARWSGIVLAALVLLLVNGYWLYRFDGFYDPPLPHGDGPDYESIAYSLSVGAGYQFAWEDPQWQSVYLESRRVAEYSQLSRRDWEGPTTSRPPALPWLIRWVYWFVPRGPLAFATVRSLSVVALSIAGLVAVGFAWRWSLREGSVFLPALAATISLGVACLDRTIKTYVEDFLTEPWALLALMGMVWGLMRWVESGGSRNSSLRWLMLGGVFFGVMLLFRSLFIFWLPVLAGGIFLAGRDPSGGGVQRGWKSAVLFVVVVCLVSGGWWVRNCEVTGRWMPMGAQGAASLRGGYSDEALADWGNWHSEAEQAMQRKLDHEEGVLGWTAVEREVALADLAMFEIWQWVGEHVWEMPKLGAMRLVSHWGPWRIDHGIWKFMAFLGWVFVWRRSRPRGILLASIFLADAWTTLVLYETGGRFLIPMHGLLYSLSGVGLAGCLALVVTDPVHRMHGLDSTMAKRDNE